MTRQRLTLGLRENLGQFTLLALDNVFVGTMVGIERNVVPALGTDTFHLSSATVLLSFIASFGLVKAVLNLVAGKLADEWGRKPVLLLGWLFGIPVPLLVMFAPTWGWIVVANALLGANQGLAWSMTVTSKMDLVGPRKRGFALGINEFSGYIGVSLAIMLSSYLASIYGPRPIPFIVAEVIGSTGFLLSVVLIHETIAFTKLEVSATKNSRVEDEKRSFWQVFAQVSFRDGTLFSCSQTGLVNKISDTAVWGLVPILMAREHFSVATIGIIASVYTTIWGVLQLGSGAWSDRIGRKFPIVLGQVLNGVGVGLVVWTHSLGIWIVDAFLMGAGTALVYPVLLSAVGDIAQPRWRASALGTYRLWRDGGYAIGGLFLGLVADALNIRQVFGVLSVVIIVSGILSAVLIKETVHIAKGMQPSRH